MGFQKSKKKKKEKKRRRWSIGKKAEDETENELPRKKEK